MTYMYTSFLSRGITKLVLSGNHDVFVNFFSKTLFAIRCEKKPKRRRVFSEY